MNHSRIYDSIISMRLSRPATGVIERHHIIPKSLGGSDDPSNIVSLSPREHYLCHKLLARAHGGKMWQALFLMSNSGVTSASGVIVTSRDFEKARKEAANFRSTDYLSRGVSKGLSNPSADPLVYQFAHPTHGELSMTRSALCERFGLTAGGVSKVVTGVRKSYKKWVFNGVCDGGELVGYEKPESKTKGKKLSRSHIRSLIKAKEKVQTVTCPACGKKGKGSVMIRWHFDRCKEATS